MKLKYKTPAFLLVWAVMISFSACGEKKSLGSHLGEDSVKEMSRAGPKKGAQNQPCQPRSFQGMSEKEEKFKQNQVQ